MAGCISHPQRYLSLCTVTAWPGSHGLGAQGDAEWNVVLTSAGNQEKRQRRKATVTLESSAMSFPGFKK